METNVQDTSIEVYHSEVKPNLSTRHKSVMQILATSEDLTNQEISYCLNWPINTVTPRVFELRAMNLVMESCRRIDKRSGRRAIAWKLVPQV